MTTTNTIIKQTLTDNRVCVINAIKWYYKTTNDTVIIEKMKSFLSFCSNPSSVEKIENSKKIKTELKFMVYGMLCKEQKEEREAKWFNSPVPAYLQGHSDINDLRAAIKQNTNNKWGI